ncbi:MAG: sulfonate transporter permease [Bacillota bacterium]|nr:sulfonate transporter permease [Bacillota bacterium]
MNKIGKLVNIIIGLSIILILWQVVVLTGRYEASLLPSPLMVLNALKEVISNGSLFTNIQVSLLRFFVGYSSAVILAVVFGLILGWFEKVWAIIDPIVQVLRPISPIAWFPFIVLWLGIGDIPAIAIIFIASFFPVLLSTVSAVKKVDKTYLKVAKNFGMKQYSVLTKIIFPASFPSIVTGLHIALGSAWVFLVAGEMVGVQSGLGFMIIDARNSLRSDLLLAAIINIGVIGLLLDKLVNIFEKWVGKTWGIAQEPERS